MSDPVRIALSGRGPLGMAISGTTAWVVATDSGQLLKLDLHAEREVGALEIGPGGSMIVKGSIDGQLFVARYDTRDSGDGVVRVTDLDEPIVGIRSGPVGGIAPGAGGTVWVLEPAGRVAHLDPVTGRTLGSVSVPVKPNEHLDLLAAGGAYWASSDHTAVRRVSNEARVVAEIDVGGGIPLASDGGLAWGARADAIWAIDPKTNAVARRVALTNVDEILAMEVADGHAWVAVRRPRGVGRVLGIDLADGSVLAEYPVSLPAAVELTTDRVWVTDYEANVVLGFARTARAGG